MNHFHNKLCCHQIKYCRDITPRTVDTSSYRSVLEIYAKYICIDIRYHTDANMFAYEI